MKTYIQYLFVLLSGFSFAQQKDTTKQKTPAFIVKMTHGMIGESRFDFTKSEWDRLTQGFQFGDSLLGNPNTYPPSDGEGTYSSSSSAYLMFSFALINNPEKQAGKRYRTTTTFHLGYGPTLRAERHWVNEDRKVIDTLISSQTGNQYFVTQNRRQDLTKTYQAQSILFGIGQHFSTNPNRIFQFETGVDLLCYVSILSNVNVTYIDANYIEGIPTGDPNTGYPGPNSYKEERGNFGGKTLAGLIMRMPLDFSFRLSKKNSVAGRMRLGMELNPGLATQFSSGLITTNFNMSGGMNFRFQF